MTNVFCYESEIGMIYIEDNGEAITKVYLGAVNSSENTNFSKSELSQEAAKQLKAYFNSKRKLFDLPLAPAGSEFQQKVWSALQTIPYGETRSYKEVAEYIQQPQAARAVGMANNKNPIMIFIPCHRVIGADGRLVGYAGGLDIKEKLLNIEKGQAGCNNV